MTGCNYSIEESLEHTMQYVDMIKSLVDEYVQVDKEGNIVYHIWKEGRPCPSIVVVSPELAAQRVQLFIKQQE